MESISRALSDLDVLLISFHFLARIGFVASFGSCIFPCGNDSKTILDRRVPGFVAPASTRFSFVFTRICHTLDGFVDTPGALWATLRGFYPIVCTPAVQPVKGSMVVPSCLVSPCIQKAHPLLLPDRHYLPPVFGCRHRTHPSASLRAMSPSQLGLCVQLLALQGTLGTNTIECP